MKRGEGGQVTAFVVVFAAAMLLFAGLVIDGGLVLAAQRRAADEAEAAARAGAQAVDIASYRASGDFVLDPEQARGAAMAYLAQTGHDGEATVAGDRVMVVVHFHQPMQILGIGGLGSVTVTGSGEARAERGVTGAEP